MNKIMRILLCVDSLQMCPRERRCPVNNARVWWDRPSRQTAFCVRQHHSSKWSFHYYSFLHRFSNNMALKLNQVTSANLALQVWKSKTVSFHCNIHLNVYQTCCGKLRTLATRSFLYVFKKMHLIHLLWMTVLPTLTRISQDRKLALCIKGRETVWNPRSPQMKAPFMQQLWLQVMSFVIRFTKPVLPSASAWTWW